MRDSPPGRCASSRSRRRRRRRFAPLAAVRLRRHVPVRGRRAAGRAAGARRCRWTPTLLAELLGSTRSAGASRPGPRSRPRPSCNGCAADRRASGVDAVPICCGVVGDLRSGRSHGAGCDTARLALLEETRRAIRVRIAGEERWLAIEDARRVRDALGVALPVGVPRRSPSRFEDPSGTWSRGSRARMARSWPRMLRRGLA